jgi:DNA-binding NarL/FixJ family response regulator
MIRVVLADDHAIVRAGLRQLLALADDMLVASEAASGAQLLEVLRGEPPDIVLLDLSMPGIAGTDLITRVRAHYPSLPLLVLSMHGEPQVARRALKAGAGGFVSKMSEPEVLLAALRKVAAGGRFIDPAVAEEMAFDQLAPAADKPHERLTDREFQVLSLLVRGLGVNEVANELAISSKTVSSHKARLMEKLGVRSNAEMVRYGMRHGLSD